MMLLFEWLKRLFSKAPAEVPVVAPIKEVETEKPLYVKPKGVPKGMKFWHYDVQKDCVRELKITKQGMLEVPPNIGPVVTAHKEDLALDKGRKRHRVAMQKYGYDI